MQKLLSAFLLLSPLTAFAQGDWGSSGHPGEFIRDQNNPWFLAKTISEVRYCLVINPEGISAQPSHVEAQTRRAIEYWQAELAAHGATDLGVGPPSTFTLTNPGLTKKCVGDEDLIVQFGYGTLTPDQLKYFEKNSEDPVDYLGVALRAAYDKEKMKGSGIILIGSDQGAKPYNNGQGVDKYLWSYDALLFRILQHEFGHVFGVQHTEEGFMAADYPEDMVRNYSEYRTLPVNSFFEPSEALDTDVDKAGFHIETHDHWASFQLSHYDGNFHLVPIAVVKDAIRSGTNHSFPLKVFLPKERGDLFRDQPIGRVTMKGPARQSFKVSGTAEIKAGVKTLVLLDLRPDGADVFFDAGDGKGFVKH